MLPVLKLAYAGPLSIEEAEARIAEEFQLSEKDRAETLPGRPQRLLYSRVHWSKYFLMKAGLVSFPSHDHFVITEQGRRMLASNPKRLSPSHFLKDEVNGKHLRPYMAMPADALASDEDAARRVTPEIYIASAHRAHIAAVKAELLERIQREPPAFLEKVILRLLVAMGYGNASDKPALRLGHVFDEGVDGVVNEDILGLDQVYVQAKRYDPDRAVTRPEVQAFAGSLMGHRASKGVFVTTSSFSQHAEKFAKRTPQHIVLIDGGRLADLMVEHDVGVKSASSLVFKRVDFQFFAASEP